MALTVEQIRATEDDEALVDLLSAEARRLLPDELFNDTDRYYDSLDSVPQGLRAMAGIYPFSVSMDMDDLAWHFSSHNDQRHIREALNGLRELELPQIADLFEKAWRIMAPHLAELRPGHYCDTNFTKWARENGIQQQIDPMNDAIWKFCKQSGPLRLLNSWVLYARKYPERCVVAEPHP
ncbi:MAG TPA: hypothetical protein VJX73_08740 [Terracidiphilus sp.]|nr:hypothetical protein [Terracidiphilus sp.]